ncbi:hypothetical protein [Streptococcus equi]|uniref:hypothetical protein n=1 Tax=Streptococcus equi TaxID=1336 RepID=UPI000F6C3AE1|nr:membrane protein [Streptococcus equi subsp. equi]HEL1218377.1 hypothetical protein [Streptococcus equi subsp. zooepidemicus]
MKGNPFNRNLSWLIAYVLLLSCYVFILVDGGFLKNSVQELEALLGQTSLAIKLFLMVISIAFSVISLLVEYFLSKFLVLLFIEAGIVSLNDVLTAKSVTLVIHLSALLLKLSPSPLFQFVVNALGIVIMYGLSIKRQGNKATALLFCLPFTLDILATLLL